MCACITRYAPSQASVRALVLYEMIHLKDDQRDKIDQRLKQQGYVWRNDLIHMDKLARSWNMPAQDRLYELVS